MDVERAPSEVAVPLRSRTPMRERKSWKLPKAVVRVVGDTFCSWASSSWDHPITMRILRLVRCAKHCGWNTYASISPSTSEKNLDKVWANVIKLSLID